MPTTTRSAPAARATLTACSGPRYTNCGSNIRVSKAASSVQVWCTSRASSRPTSMWLSIFWLTQKGYMSTVGASFSLLLGRMEMANLLFSTGASR